MTQEQPSSLYIPPNCRPLSEDTAKQQIRLGIQGFPGTGKDWAVLGTPDRKQIGFPNCMVLNLDRGLGAFQGCDWIHEIPFWKISFGGKKEDQKEKVTRWLNEEGPKLTSNQTLIIDSLSTLEQIYHIWFKFNEVELAMTNSGKINEFAEWRLKEQWFNELHVIIKSFACDVILLCHESERPDKPTSVGQPGTYTGKIRPVLSGKFGDIVIREYTDWFRQHCGAKTNDPKPETLAAWRMTKAEFMAMQASFVGDTVYFWQTKGDDKFDAKASSLVNPPTYIPATYESFLKYSKYNNNNNKNK